ncbi:phosphocholine cytidylyltransferase family protein [Halomicrobium urmianum]|uniref:phosphocholine cytidylyltransferase family protein n=1 Tax=Halomicrobium urmianum TaxID=1586233 RepID=UPI001CD97DE3|nr:phosphocholine cytidylyltransferase family protein [Halomicrobium urmianum]
MCDERSHAVVLAAGMGTRLRPVTESTPKTLVEVGDRHILGHIFESLDRTGYERVTAVTGFEADQVREFCESAGFDLDVDFVHSDAYDSTNNLYSLWLARDRLDDGFTLVNSDTLFPAASLRRLAATDGSALLVDAEKTLGDEEMKVRTEGDEAVAIGKDLSAATGEYIGVSKFSPAGADALVDELDALVDAGRTNEWYEAAFDRIFDAVDVSVVPVDGDWIEIDDHDDLRTGRRLFGEVTAE